MHFQAVQQMHLENDLRKAIENNQLVLYYQPIVNIKNQRIQGLEALVRWQHPERGLLAPGHFINIAENTGLIIPIGRWLLHTACQQLAEWENQFPHHFLKMSVNLSVKQLDIFLLEQLDEVLNNYNLKQNSLVLEITESMLVANIEKTCDLLNQIKAKGIGLSIDDFGTGYSSLSYLHQLPVNSLKIDRSFVSPANLSDRHQVIAKSIIALSKLLKLHVIAEGVETPEQFHWLKKLGCEAAQGYLFSRPVPVSDITEL
ncbi:putative bifunctional diguanylate cyclase/phosphodiesterase [Arthrospira platensis BEA 1257B]